MKYIKSAFIICLFSFVFISAIVLALNKPKVTEIVPVLNTNSTNIPKNINPTTDNSCIITVDGVKYDITKYRYLHSGGDIFKCGTDMTNIFYNQHSNSFLKQILKYKI